MSSEPGSVSRIITPEDVRYGVGATDEVTAFLSDEQVLVVTDGTLVDTPATDPVFDALGRTDATIDRFEGVTTEPKIRTVSKATATARDCNASVIVGVGGGSVLDTAKLTAAAAPTDSSIRDVMGMGNADPGLPLVLLPTTAGTGSEMTHAAVVADEADGGTKKVAHDRDLMATLALIDPALTASVPPAVAAATGIDTLTHAIEAYVTTERTAYADGLARRAIELVGEHLPRTVHENHPESRLQMGIAAALGGQAFTNAGLGAVHALTYPLGVEYGVGHGLANAVLLPHVVRFNAPADPERFAAIDSLLAAGAGDPFDGRDPAVVGDRTDRAENTADRIETLCTDLGLPTRLRDLSVDVRPDRFDRFAEICFEHSRHNIEANPCRVERSDVVQIYEAAY